MENFIFGAVDVNDVVLVSLLLTLSYFKLYSKVSIVEIEKDERLLKISNVYFFGNTLW